LSKQQLAKVGSSSRHRVLLLQLLLLQLLLLFRQNPCWFFKEEPMGLLVWDFYRPFALLVTQPPVLKPWRKPVSSYMSQGFLLFWSHMLSVVSVCAGCM